MRLSIGEPRAARARTAGLFAPVLAALGVASGGCLSNPDGGAPETGGGGQVGTGGGGLVPLNGGSGGEPQPGGSGGQLTTGGAGGVPLAGSGGDVGVMGGAGGVPPTSGGGGSSTGGSGGSSTGGSGGSADPSATARISACIDSLPWGQDNITDRAGLIDVIVRTCQEFAPPGPEWQTYCQLFLVAAINKESSFNADSVVEDAYGGAADPTVGLTQIRFSSTVKDYYDGGPLDALARIGCEFPTSISGDDARPYLEMMKDPACNIALGAWYYFVYATGNGGTSVVYLWQYCQGEGVAANLVIGMLSHLRGPSGAVGGGTDPYVDQIRAWFDDPACNGPSLGTHPFELTLQPEPSKYCR